MNKNNRAHIHFKCIKCDKIIDIDNNDIYSCIKHLNSMIEQSYDLKICDTDITCFGLCNTCKDM